ncbi:GTP cyclohydrolase [Acinetobacter sp. B5B]|uniref:YciI family protein n=1 Tax=Acinetobacter baretiae TaxID=2605383 RepID=UPI0018C30243|nr:YciI family protein [Acinetobacter baretiae]MBF7683051.1 GTP cyclohydrolase [Acinetobacter baretiae]MBF7684297.1 GTP cyclohydrolase [Acinetobacter baretiae]
MIIVTLTYKKSWVEVDKILDEHLKFLDVYYAQKTFLASGRRAHREGGIILVLSSSIEDVKRIMENDPFYIHDVADYSFTGFEVSKHLTGELDALEW